MAMDGRANRINHRNWRRSRVIAGRFSGLLFCFSTPILRECAVGEPQWLSGQRTIARRSHRWFYLPLQDRPPGFPSETIYRICGISFWYKEKSYSSYWFPADRSGLPAWQSTGPVSAAADKALSTAWCFDKYSLQDLFYQSLQTILSGIRWHDVDLSN